MNRAIAALVALACVAAKPQDVAYNQISAVADMAWGFGLQPDVTWRLCGEVNAWYDIRTADITLCVETLSDPAAVFIAAHETGHALVYGLDLTKPKYAYADERAADELAAMYLVYSDQTDELVAGAQWFMRMGHEEPSDDPHAPAQERAHLLLCLADGAENGTPECRTLWNRTVAYWTDQLGQ